MQLFKSVLLFSLKLIPSSFSADDTLHCYVVDFVLMSTFSFRSLSGSQALDSSASDLTLSLGTGGLSHFFRDVRDLLLIKLLMPYSAEKTSFFMSLMVVAPTEPCIGLILFIDSSAQASLDLNDILLVVLSLLISLIFSLINLVATD